MLFTIGYEGTDVSSLVAELQAAGIQTLIDVREMPLSRKKGFSKTALSGYVTAAGISYVHLKQLGAPKPIRHALRAGGSWEEYCVGYSHHLEHCEGDLAELGQMARDENICLLCFEANYCECHRSLIAERLGATGQIDEVIHLSPQTGSAYQQKLPA